MPRIKRTKTAAANPARSSELIETQATESGSRLVLNALKNLVTFRPENAKNTFVEWSVFLPKVKHTQ